MSKRKLDTLPVVIRFEGKGKATRKDWRLSEIVAIFPSEPGTYAVNTMTCYSPVGGHGSCASNYASRTKPATREQVRAMLAELRRIGYKRVRVISRATPSHWEMRRKALEKTA